MIAAELCAIAIAAWTSQAASWYEPRIPAMTDVCVEIADAAHVRGADPYLMVAIGWQESRFRDGLVSGAGAHGPMQVIPRYHCPDGELRGCDLVDAGVAAYLRFLDLRGSEAGALCAYNGGNNCGESARAYARRVAGLADELVTLYTEQVERPSLVGQGCSVACGC